jgi:tetratricopeptide (TPR) repeat protein
LRTRFVLSRLPVPALPAHIDLLHAARSIWKRRLASVRLTEIEREILHFERADDIPGAEIPGRYFEYLRCGRAECLAPILEHNQNDLIALAALLGVMITRFEQLDALCDARDALAFGRLSLRARDAERALRFANAALSSSDADAVTRHALLFASEVRRELGETRHAAELLEQALLLAPEPPLRASIHVRLAKLYEHDLDQLSSALRHARHTEAAEGAHGHGRRLGRLHRRLLRPASATSRSAT